MRYFIYLSGFLFLLVWLAALTWSGSEFFSYLDGESRLSLEATTVRQLSRAEPVTVELRGTGFKAGTRAYLHPDVNNHAAIVGSFPLQEIVFDMEKIGDLLFVAGSNNGVRAFDVSDPLKPKMKPEHSMQRSTVLDIERSGNRLFFSCGLQGVRIAEYHKGRKNLIKWKVLPAWSAVVASKVVGNFLYVVAGQSGLMVYDVNDLDRKTPIKVVESEDPLRDIAAYGEYIYLAAARGGVLVYRTTASGMPEFVRKIQIAGSVSSLTIIDDSLFILGNGILSRYGLQDEASPRFLSQLKNPHSSQRIYQFGQRTYIADKHSGLGLFDGTLEESTVADYINVGAGVRAIAHVGDYIYAAVNNVGLKIIDPTLIIPQQLVASIYTPGFAKDFIVSEGQMYIVGGLGGIYRLNLRSSEMQPVKFSEFKVKLLAVADDHLFAFSGRHESLKVYNISHPEKPQLVASPPQLVAGHAAITDEYLVYGGAEEGLGLADITDLENPIVLDRFEDVLVTRVYAEKDLVVVAGERNGVQLFRIKNGRLIRQGVVKLPFPLDHFSAAVGVALRGDTLFIANGDGGLVIVNIADPDQPKILSSLSLPGFVNAVSVNGDRAYALSRFSGIYTIDISRLSAAHVIDFISMPDAWGGFHRSGGLMYLGSRYMGIKAIPEPREIEKLEVLAPERLRMTITPPDYPGRYSVQIGSEGKSVTAEGILRYQ